MHALISEFTVNQITDNKNMGHFDSYIDTTIMVKYLVHPTVHGNICLNAKFCSLYFFLASTEGNLVLNC